MIMMLPTPAPEVHRIAQISDFHCSRLTWNPLQFLCKRWLGNFNLLFNRSHVFVKNLGRRLSPFLTTQHLREVMISGDLTSTSQVSEFILAHEIVQGLREQGLRIH